MKYKTEQRSLTVASVSIGAAASSAGSASSAIVSSAGATATASSVLSAPAYKPTRLSTHEFVGNMTVNPYLRGAGRCLLAGPARRLLAGLGCGLLATCAGSLGSRLICSCFRCRLGSACRLRRCLRCRLRGLGRRLRSLRSRLLALWLRL